MSRGHRFCRGARRNVPFQVRLWWWPERLRVQGWRDKKGGGGPETGAVGGGGLMELLEVLCYITLLFNYHSGLLEGVYECALWYHHGWRFRNTNEALVVTNPTCFSQTAVRATTPADRKWRCCGGTEWTGTDIGTWTAETQAFMMLCPGVQTWPTSTEVQWINTGSSPGDIRSVN